jgi:hypothetical protein
MIHSVLKKDIVSRGMIRADRVGMGMGIGTTAILFVITANQEDIQLLTGVKNTLVKVIRLDML